MVNPGTCNHSVSRRRRAVAEIGRGLGLSQLHLLGERRFWPLFWTQFLGAFNDNLFKNALVILVAAALGVMLFLGTLDPVAPPPPTASEDAAAPVTTAPAPGGGNGGRPRMARLVQVRRRPAEVRTGGPPWRDVSEIVVVRRDRLGDVVLTLPAADALRAAAEEGREPGEALASAHADGATLVVATPRSASCQSMLR